MAWSVPGIWSSSAMRNLKFHANWSFSRFVQTIIYNPVKPGIIQAGKRLTTLKSVFLPDRSIAASFAALFQEMPH